jgi:hypothetical protein
MRMRIAVGSAALMAGLVLTFGTADRANAQKNKTAKAGKDDKAAAKDESQAPKFLYGHDFRVRPGGKTDWVDAVKIGAEVYEDEVTKTFVGVSQSGALAVIPTGKLAEQKKTQWLTAHDLKVRKPGELDFTDKTKRFGVEVFKDVGSDKLLYVCETASIAFADIPSGLVTDRGPHWHHGFELRARAPEQSFDNAKKFGVEVFKDENTGGLIYITETGAIATGVAPSAPPDPKKIAPPEIEYGVNLRVRGAEETDFTDKTKKFGVEVFRDPNAGNRLIYFSQAGSIATAPNPGKFEDRSGVTWRRSMALKARKGGDKGFDSAKKYGIEVFEDNRTGHLIFISETGAIAVVPKGK